MTGLEWLKAHVGYQGDDCLIWPLSKNKVSGYGQLGIGGIIKKPHREMCALAHGPQPSPKHQAAHSCHVRACVNPRHLAWKTHSENMLDKRENGTSNSTAWWGRKGKITAEQAAAILALKGKKTQDAIAKQFSITESNVRKIHTGQIWSERIAALRAG